MLLEFLGAAHEVTGSCHFLQCQDKRILVDCGMEQGPDLYVNQEIPVNASNIDKDFRCNYFSSRILVANISASSFECVTITKVVFNF